MASVQLRNVNKTYSTSKGPVHAVQNFNLEIADGEFVALLGPSGCGKTSTLRMIVGLEEISGGQVCFDGEPVNQQTPEQRNVAMAFETYALYPNFSVAENLGFPLEVRGIDAVERERQVKHIAELLRIDNILAQKPLALSGGQQQRVGLGRALIRDPAVLILDEVLSHIDAHLKFQMLFDLKRIHQDLGKTTIFVTHDQVEALALADRVAVMSNARLQQAGTRDALYHAPTNRFVADFIGEPPTNFFATSCAAQGRQGNGVLSLVSGASDLSFQPGEQRQRLIKESNNTNFLVGIRPQNLFLDAHEIISAQRQFSALDAEVMINEYLGEKTILTVKNGDDIFRALVEPEVTLGAGEQVKLYYRPDDVMVFDADTEALLA